MKTSLSAKRYMALVWGGGGLINALVWFGFVYLKTEAGQPHPWRLWTAIGCFALSWIPWLIAMAYVEIMAQSFNTAPHTGQTDSIK